MGQWIPMGIAAAAIRVQDMLPHLKPCLVLEKLSFMSPVYIQVFDLVSSVFIVCSEFFLDWIYIMFFFLSSYMLVLCAGVPIDPKDGVF